MFREKVWHWLGCAAVHRLAQWRLDMDVRWQAALPAGPKIIAPNHPTTTDPFLMLTLFSEQVSILVTGAAFRLPLFGGILRRSGHVPVVEGNGRAAMEQAEALLAAGRTVVVFPEGALSPAAGGFQRPRTGAVRLALSAGVPIVPVGIHLDGERVRRVRVKEAGRPVEGRLYWGGPYAVTVGRPMYLDGNAQDREVVNTASDQLMERIAALSGESALRLNRMLQTQRQPVTRPLVSLT